MTSYQFPEMVRVRQTFDTRKLTDISSHISDRIDQLSPQLPVSPGQTVAVACSSRGISDYPLILNTLVTKLKGLGLKPFLVPAMGSHGAGTARGQKEVLLHLGLTPEAVGAKIRSSLDTVNIGTTEQGIPVEVDRLALEADHIVLVNRVKKHTDFMGEFESGLMKIMAIGLGKISGAGVYHRAMMNLGASEVIGAVARHVLGRCNILMGLATIENGYRDVAGIGIFPAGEIESGEKTLLAQSKAISPSLPVDAADIILIDEIGKEISGAGFDTRVVGRIRLPGTPEPVTPDITRIILSDITAVSEGNACGFGLADIITARLAGKVDRNTTDINTIVSMALEMGKTPLVMPNDKEALNLAIRCIGMVPLEEIRIIRIKNTLSLEEVDLSTAFLQQIRKDPGLEITRGPRPMSFSRDGYLTGFFSQD